MVYVLPTSDEGAVPGAGADVLRNPTRDTVDPFDLPERGRMYALATQFVANHVGSVRSEPALKSTDRTFANRTIVVSEKSIPRFPRRFVRANWAIDSTRVVDTRKRTDG